MPCGRRFRQHYNGPMVRVCLAGLCVSAAICAASAGAAGQARRAAAGPLVIGHAAVADFERIPEAFVQRASRLRFLLRSASIGDNISLALDCLMDNFPDRPRRPNFCDRGIPRGQAVFSRRYDRSNWKIEPRGNPGWWQKVRDFADRLEKVNGQDAFDVAAFNFNYGDGIPGSEIAEKFFATTPDGRFGNVGNIQAVQKAHPDLTVVWWTMALPRRSASEMRDFNTKMRAYARTNGLVLFDLADIESHAPDGTPCLDNQGAGLEALCAQYTNEKDAGHLNALGGQRVAKALWVLMARLAGWEGT
jgi:hypothetical protein